MCCYAVEGGLGPYLCIKGHTGAFKNMTDVAGCQKAAKNTKSRIEHPSPKLAWWSPLCQAHGMGALLCFGTIDPPQQHLTSGMMTATRLLVISSSTPPPCHGSSSPLLNTMLLPAAMLRPPHCRTRKAAVQSSTTTSYSNLAAASCDRTCLQPYVTRMKRFAGCFLCVLNGPHLC